MTSKDVKPRLNVDRGTRLWVLAAILVVAAMLRFWRLGQVALIPDESYYWLWSERLAPSYYDNPAGVAWMVRLSTLIGGQGEAGIRWLNALLGVAAVFLAYRIGARLLSERAALLAAALLAVGAPYLILSRFVYTDALQLALMLLNLLTLLPFLPPTDRRAPSIPTWRFWAAALSTAALLNTKYNAYLYAPAMAALLIALRPSLLRDRRAWWAAAVALLGLAPALAWNAAHGWASYRWQFAHFTQQTLHTSTLWGRAWHAVRYLGLPLALTALAGAIPPRRAMRMVLYLPAMVWVLPLLLSPTDSPRNLVNGTALLLLLGCDALCRWTAHLQGTGPLLTTLFTRPRREGAASRSVRLASRSVRLASRSVRFTAPLGARPRQEGAASRFVRFTAPLGAITAPLLGLLLILWAGVYGLGTIRETEYPTRWPHSPAATAIRQDSLGWRDAPRLGLDPQAFTFAVDYSIASQLRYYARVPVQTAWGQYQIWGIPELQDPAQAQQPAIILALTYVEPALISQRLQAAFVEMEGPTALFLREGNETRPLHVWTARGRQVDAETFLRMFDLLDLAEASRADRGPEDGRR